MKDSSFYSAGNESAIRSLQRPVDLEKELSKRGFPLAFYGRIDCDSIPEKTIHDVNDDNGAADAIASIVRNRKLSGETVIVWNDAGINPVAIDAAMLTRYAMQICEEDWDCWIFPRQVTGSSKNITRAKSASLTHRASADNHYHR